MQSAREKAAAVCNQKLKKPLVILQ